MINILVEGMTSGKGGKETYIINIFRAFNKDKYSFSFVAYDDNIAYQEEIEAAGAEIIWIPSRNKDYFEFRRALNNLFAKNSYDVLWANKTSLSSCETLEIAKKHKVPLRIVHAHSSSNMGGKLTYLLHNVNKFLIRKWANEYFACSDSAAKWFFGNGSCKQMKNGINTEEYRYSTEVRDRIRSELNIDNYVVIGHIGRFSIEKNHQKLISVFYEIHKRKKNTKLVLCGDGEERRNIELLIKELNLENDVLLLGIINNVNEILQAMDILIMPSLFEGLPFALLEAQASGLRCLVSDTVSQDSDVLGCNTFLPLMAEDNIWAEYALSIEPNNNRRESAYQMKLKGFDILDCAKQIEGIITEKLSGQEE